MRKKKKKQDQKKTQKTEPRQKDRPEIGEVVIAPLKSVILGDKIRGERFF